MENSAKALPSLDLFGEMVVIQRRVFGPRPKNTRSQPGAVQLGFLDILEMSEEALEIFRLQDEVTEDYIEWLRGYLLKLTLRQAVHPQVSAENRAEALAWISSDDEHPFSFKVCCTAFEADHEDVREGVYDVIRKAQR